MVRDPSIVSPSLTGVFIGGGHNKHGTGSRCTLPKQCRPPSPRRRWRCDRSSYKRNLFSRIRVRPVHYLTGPETTEIMCVCLCVCVCVCLRDSAAPSAGGCRNWLTTASRRLPDRRVQNVWSLTVYVRSVLITSTVDPSKAIHNTLVPISLEGSVRRQTGRAVRQEGLAVRRASGVA